jgi:hypothetical protein
MYALFEALNYISEFVKVKCKLSAFVAGNSVFYSQGRPPEMQIHPRLLTHGIGPLSYGL